MSGALLPALTVPLLAAGPTALLRGTSRSLVGVAAAAVALAGALVTAGTVRGTRTAIERTVQLPGAGEVLLVVDGLAAALMVMATLVALAVLGAAALEDRRDPARRHRGYWPLMLTLLAALQALFLAGDLLTAYLLLEVVGVCGALLVVLRGGRDSILAGTRYLYAELAASTTMLLGVALVWWQAGTVRFGELAAALEAAPAGRIGLTLITVGLLVKVPLAPLHLWIPAAHTLAPSAVSPLLSGVMVKAALAVLVRLWLLAVPAQLTPAAAQLLGALGAVAIVWGSLSALRSTGLKRLIASSTVAQLGLLTLLVPMAAAGGGDAWTGGGVLAVAHALAKAAMLLAAALIVDSARLAGVTAEPDVLSALSSVDRSQAGTRRWPVLVQLRGSVARRPVAVAAFAIGGVSLVGLPPTGGFVAKWYLLLAAVATGQWWWVVVMIVGTLLTVGYLMRFLRPAFAPPDEPDPRVDGDLRDVVALALALSTVVVGLWPGPLIDLLSVGAPLGGVGP